MLHPDAMEKQEMGELLRLLHAARRSGVLGQIMDTMEVGEKWDATVAVPPGVADFKVWSQTVIVMDKFADMNWSFSELIAAGEGDAKIARYISWIVGTYEAAVKDPQNQAEDFGMFARACGWKPKTKGYQRKTK